MAENNACGPEQVAWERAERWGLRCLPRGEGRSVLRGLNAEAASDPGTGQGLMHRVKPPRSAHSDGGKKPMRCFSTLTWTFAK